MSAKPTPKDHSCGRCNGKPAPFGYRLASGMIWACAAHRAEADAAHEKHKRGGV